MQFLLDVTSPVVEPTPQVRQIGFTPHDQVTESQLPFVQVYAPIIELTDEAEQRPGILVLQIDIIDGKGTRQAREDTLEAFDQTLRLDPSFQGMVAKGFVSARTVAERGDLERTVAGITVTVQLSVGTTPDISSVDVLDFSDSTKYKTGSPIFDALEDSRVVKGAVGARRFLMTGDDLIIEASEDSGAFVGQLDLRASVRMRTEFYQAPLFQTAFREMSLGLFQNIEKSNGGIYLPTEDRFRGAHGWQHMVWRHRETPDTIIGAGPGSLGGIRVIQFIWNNVDSGFQASRTGVELLSFRYHERDKVSTDAGFHQDPERV